MPFLYNLVSVGSRWWWLLSWQSLPHALSVSILYFASNFKSWTTWWVLEATDDDYYITMLASITNVLSFSTPEALLYSSSNDKWHTGSLMMTLLNWWRCYTCPYQTCQFQYCYELSSEAGCRPSLQPSWSPLIFPFLFAVEELYGTQYQSCSLSLIGVGSGFHSLCSSLGCGLKQDEKCEKCVGCHV